MSIFLILIVLNNYQYFIPSLSQKLFIVILFIINMSLNMKGWARGFLSRGKYTNERYTHMYLKASHAMGSNDDDSIASLS